MRGRAGQREKEGKKERDEGLIPGADAALKRIKAATLPVATIDIGGGFGLHHSVSSSPKVD